MNVTKLKLMARFRPIVQCFGTIHCLLKIITQLDSGLKFSIKPGSAVAVLKRAVVPAKFLFSFV